MRYDPQIRERTVTRYRNAVAKAKAQYHERMTSTLRHYQDGNASLAPALLSDACRETCAYHWATFQASLKAAEVRMNEGLFKARWVQQYVNKPRVARWPARRVG